MSGLFPDPSTIDLGHRPRTVSFENPTGARGAAGSVAGGRKGAPNRRVQPGETVVLADIDGPGRVGHFWLTIPPMPPEQLRSVWLEVFYDGATEPSISVPVPDFFGAVLGRPVPYSSALQSTQEGRGYNSWIPMPFRRHLRVQLTNSTSRRFELYYQFDLTLGPVSDDAGILHASFRRENPTTLRRDFTIADGFIGPGRFLGCNVGIRVAQEPSWFAWYGEGEVKMYLDDDDALPTWCGTGLEDYVGTAWGMGAHQTEFQGVPLLVSDPSTSKPMPDMVGFYRWHLPDPVVFERSLRVTIQQIGAVILPPGADEARAAIESDGVLAGNGWQPIGKEGAAFAIVERVDDYCATAFVYCRDVQPVVTVPLADAVADIARFPYERGTQFETMLASV